MILVPYFREDLIEHIKNEPDETFLNMPVTKQELLDDNAALERLWVLYQKNIEDYDVDADYAYGDAIYEVYGNKVKGWCE